MASPLSTQTTDPQSQTSPAARRQLSEVLTVSVASPASPDAALPAFKQVYRPPREIQIASNDGAGAAHDMIPHGAPQDELPVSHCCAIQRSFSGSASPSIASPNSYSNEAHPRARAGRAVLGSSSANDNGHGAAAAPVFAPDGAILVRREQCGVAMDDECHSSTGSEAPELTRVQTDLAPLRILRDFEARTFGQPPSLHNLLPLAVPASAASSPRSLPQSPLGVSKPASAAAVNSHRCALAISYDPSFLLP